MYPVGAPDKELTDAWTWENFLTAAEKCFKAGYPFGLPMSTCTDSINANGVVFTAYGAQLVDEEGNITVKSDATRQVLEYFQKLVRFVPESVWAWDNASNNKSLISGQTSLIQNPPSAYAVAKRDAPKIAEQLWTVHSPKGPKGRFDPSVTIIGRSGTLTEQISGEEPFGPPFDARIPGKVSDCNGGPIVRIHLPPAKSRAKCGSNPLSSSGESSELATISAARIRGRPFV
jgi:hypothetical protein